jgi:HK97 family phage prohead protease
MQKYLTGTIKAADDNRYSAWASTINKDRDGDVIRPEAFAASLPGYLKTNPVILLGHNMGGLPVGKAVSGKIVKNQGLQIDIEFAGTDLGREVRYLVDNGFLNTLSVGFIPRDWTEMKGGGREFSSVDLLEVSVVTVPSNAGATIIRSAESKGAALPTLAKIYEIKRERAIALADRALA